MKLSRSFSALLWAGLVLGMPAPALAKPLSQSVAQSLPAAVPDTMLETAAAPITTPRETARETIRPSATKTAYSTAATQSTSSSQIVLSLQQRRVFLYRNDMLVSSYPVAIGADDTPTPEGEFTVSHMVTNPVWQSPWTGEIHEPGADSALGLRWIEFATSDEGAFGFHGTPTVESIGQAASNGCVRMHNEDVVALFAQVDVGTRVVVRQ